MRGLGKGEGPGWLGFLTVSGAALDLGGGWRLAGGVGVGAEVKEGEWG